VLSQILEATIDLAAGGHDSSWDATTISLSVTDGCVADRAPDPLWGGRHIDMRDAERRQGIEDRVDYPHSILAARPTTRRTLGPQYTRQ
jgi:hypothetical protein